MPVSAYFGGHGEEVMRSMVGRYGQKKGTSVFYATANKRDATPAGSTALERRRVRQSAAGKVGAFGPAAGPRDSGVSGQEGSRGRELGVRVARLKAARRALG